MLREIFAGSLVVVLLLSAGSVTTTATREPILSGPLAKLDIKDAEVEAVRGTPKGQLIIAQHFALDPTWLDPHDHIVALTQQHHDYLVHDALIKTMPQGLLTYSLAEHAAATADFTKVTFRLRPGLKFHDGPLSGRTRVRVRGEPCSPPTRILRCQGGGDLDGRVCILCLHYCTSRT